MSLAAPMRCSTGCGSYCYPGRGQCLAHLEDTAPGHPWLPCTSCRRALDRLLGPLAGPEDELCDACALGRIAAMTSEEVRDELVSVGVDPDVIDAEAVVFLASIGLAEVAEA